MSPRFYFTFSGGFLKASLSIFQSPRPPAVDDGAVDPALSGTAGPFFR
jgi:hypothetical protein